MNLTSKIIEQKGFKKINNSMWRNGNITLQNAWIHSKGTLIDKIWNTKKGFKACYDGRFISMIEAEEDLDHIIRMYIQ